MLTLAVLVSAVGVVAAFPCWEVRPFPGTHWSPSSFSPGEVKNATLGSGASLTVTCLGGSVTSKNPFGGTPAYSLHIARVQADGGYMWYDAKGLMNQSDPYNPVTYKGVSPTDNWYLVFKSENDVWNEFVDLYYSFRNM